MRAQVLLAVSLLCFAGLVDAGAVRRDPVTGKWVEASTLPDVVDPRASGGGGDFFSGFGFVDNREQPNTLQHSAVEASSTLQPTITTRDHASHRKSKYVAEIPITANVQTEQQSSANEDEQQTLAQTGAPTVIEHVIHHFEPQEQIQVRGEVLTATPLGSVCRFQGLAPISGCPAEATNGCVDRTPCKLPCKNGGYFRWRCLGPQTVSPDELSELPPEEPPKPAAPLRSSDEVVHELAARLGAAIQNNDYTGLARAILQSQSGSSPAANAHLALAVSHLAQVKQSVVSENEDQTA